MITSVVFVFCYEVPNFRGLNASGPVEFSLMDKGFLEAPSVVWHKPIQLVYIIFPAWTEFCPWATEVVGPTIKTPYT